MIMQRTMECACCCELPEVEEHLEDSSTCIASVEVLGTKYLYKDVLSLSWSPKGYMTIFIPAKVIM